MRLDDSILIWAIKHGELLTYEHVAGELECTPRFVRTILARYPKIVKPIRRGHRTVRFDPFQILKLKHHIHREASERGLKIAKEKGWGIAPLIYGHKTVRFDERDLKRFAKLIRKKESANRRLSHSSFYALCAAFAICNDAYSSNAFVQDLAVKAMQKQLPRRRRKKK